MNADMLNRGTEHRRPALSLSLSFFFMGGELSLSLSLFFFFFFFHGVRTFPPPPSGSATGHLGILIGIFYFFCKRPPSRPVIIYVHSFSHVMFLRKIKIIDSLVGYYAIQPPSNLDYRSKTYLTRCELGLSMYANMQTCIAFYLFNSLREYM